MDLSEQDRGLAAPAQAATATLLGWLVALAGAIWLLTALGRGPLAVPSILETPEWRAWLASKDGPTIFFAVLRLFTLAIAWYLSGTIAVGTVAHLVRSARLLAIANLMALPTVRRTLQAAFGAGLAAASLTAGSSSVASVPPPVATAVAPARLAPAAEQPPQQPVPSIPPLRARTDPRSRAAVDHAARAQPESLEEPGPATPTADVEPSRATWTVQPGDHLWSIAERTLARAWERQPSDDETTAYWQRLIARNRPVLTDPGNPDLILPGQVFELPEISRS